MQNFQNQFEFQSNTEGLPPIDDENDSSKLINSSSGSSSSSLGMSQSNFSPTMSPNQNEAAFFKANAQNQNFFQTSIVESTQLEEESAQKIKQSAVNENEGLKEAPVGNQDQSQFVEIQLLKQHLKSKYGGYTDQQIDDIIQKFINEYLHKIQLENKKNVQPSGLQISDTYKNDEFVEDEGRSSLNSLIDWEDNGGLERYWKKQKKLENITGFRPSEYFGAVSVDQLEVGTEDPRIDELFSDCFGINPPPPQKIQQYQKQKQPIQSQKFKPQSQSQQNQQQQQSQSKQKPKAKKNTFSGMKQATTSYQSTNNLQQTILEQQQHQLLNKQQQMAAKNNLVSGNNNVVQNDQSCKITLNFYNQFQIMNSEGSLPQGYNPLQQNQAAIDILQENTKNHLQKVKQVQQNAFQHQESQKTLIQHKSLLQLQEPYKKYVSPKAKLNKNLTIETNELDSQFQNGHPNGNFYNCLQTEAALPTYHGQSNSVEQILINQEKMVSSPSSCSNNAQQNHGGSSIFKYKSQKNTKVATPQKKIASNSIAKLSHHPSLIDISSNNNSQIKATKKPSHHYSSTLAPSGSSTNVLQSKQPFKSMLYKHHHQTSSSNFQTQSNAPIHHQHIQSVENKPKQTVQLSYLSQKQLPDSNNTQLQQLQLQQQLSISNNSKPPAPLVGQMPQSTFSIYQSAKSTQRVQRNHAKSTTQDNFDDVSQSHVNTNILINPSQEMVGSQDNSSPFISPKNSLIQLHKKALPNSHYNSLHTSSQVYLNDVTNASIAAASGQNLHAPHRVLLTTTNASSTNKPLFFSPAAQKENYQKNQAKVAETSGGLKSQMSSIIKQSGAGEKSNPKILQLGRNASQTMYRTTTNNIAHKNIPKSFLAPTPDMMGSENFSECHLDQQSPETSSISSSRATNLASMQTKTTQGHHTQSSFNRSATVRSIHNSKPNVGGNSNAGAAIGSYIQGASQLTTNSNGNGNGFAGVSPSVSTNDVDRISMAKSSSSKFKNNQSIAQLQLNTINGSASIKNIKLNHPQSTKQSYIQSNISLTVQQQSRKNSMAPSSENQQTHGNQQNRNSLKKKDVPESARTHHDQNKRQQHQNLQNDQRSVERNAVGQNKANNNVITSLERKRQQYKTQKSVLCQAKSTQNLVPQNASKAILNQFNPILKSNQSQAKLPINFNNGSKNSAITTKQYKNLKNDQNLNPQHLQGQAQNDPSSNYTPVSGNRIQRQESFNKTIQRINKSLDKIKQVFGTTNSTTAQGVAEGSADNGSNYACATNTSGIRSSGSNGGAAGSSNNMLSNGSYGGTNTTCGVTANIGSSCQSAKNARGMKAAEILQSFNSYSTFIKNTQPVLCKDTPITNQLIQTLSQSSSNKYKNKATPYITKQPSNVSENFQNSYNYANQQQQQFKSTVDNQNIQGASQSHHNIQNNSVDNFKKYLSIQTNPNAISNNYASSSGSAKNRGPSGQQQQFSQI